MQTEILYYIYNKPKSLQKYYKKNALAQINKIKNLLGNGDQNVNS